MAARRCGPGDRWGGPRSFAGDLALFRRRFEIGLAGVVLLVLLRMSIGWHFLYQGVWKLENPGFSSAGFLSQAKGPLADYYHGLIPDFWGTERLDPKRAVAELERYREAFGRHYELTPEQADMADKLLEGRRQQFQGFFAEQADDLATYRHEVEKLDQLRHSPSAVALPYQRKRNWDKQKALLAQSEAWIKPLETWTEEFHQQLTGLLKPEQRSRGDSEALVKKEPLDGLITFSNVAIGLCLLVGLFTRFASLSGAVFLASIVAAQPEWPTIYPHAPPAAGRSLIVNKEFVEMMALFALACTPVGRWGGLDYWIHRLLTRLLGRRKNS